MYRQFLKITLVGLICLLNQMPAQAKAEYRIEKIMASWLDEPIDKVVMQWGMPDEEKEIMGKKVYIWKHDKHTVTGFLTSTHKWFCDRVLTVDADNKVYRADSYGNNCPFGAVGAQYKHWANWEKYKKLEVDSNRVKHRSATTF
jgi:hypothetical protein